MEKTLNEKIHAIVNALNGGMPKNKIDRIGNGGAVRTILKGGRPEERKIEEMYANVVVYQEKKVERSQFKIKVPPKADLTRQEKEQVLIDAMKNGIPKSTLDKKCKGASAARLQQGARVRLSKIDTMYDNLLSFLGYASQQTKEGQGAGHENYLKEKVRTLEMMVSSLFEQTTALKAQVQTLQAQQQSFSHLPQPKKKTRTILGISIVQKTDKVRGKAYKRWYGTYRANGKQRWIYIGNDLSLAQQKISAALLHEGQQSCKK